MQTAKTTLDVVSSDSTRNTSREDIHFVYEKPIELLDESVHQDNITLTKKINEILKRYGKA